MMRSILALLLMVSTAHAVLPIQATHTPGQTLVGIVRKISAGVEGDYWDDTNQVFTGSPAGTDHHITLTETTGRYVGVTSAALATYDGLVTVGIYDTTAAAFVGTDIAVIVSGVEWSDNTLRTDIATVDSNVDAVLLDTAEIGAAGAGLTAVPYNSAWDAEIESEASDALVALDLDHLINTALPTDWATNVTANSALDYLADDGTAVYDRTSDSQQAIADGVSGGGPSAAAIADAIWDEAQADHVAAGSFGVVASEIASILVDTAEIGSAGDGLTAVPWNSAWSSDVSAAVWDEAQASHVAAGSFGLVASEVADILVDTAEIGAAGIGLTAIPWNAAWDAEVATELTDIGLDHLVSAAVVGADIADNSIVGSISAISGDWDDFSMATDSLEAIGTSPAPPPASEDFENLQVFYQAEKNLATVISVRVADADGTPSTGAVTATDTAAPASSPSWSSSTNAATSTGVPGLYQLTLTAAEMNVDQLLVRITAGAGNVGYMLLLNEYRDLELDWQAGGELRTILSSITASSVSSVIVSPQRTWFMGQDGATASNIVTLTPNDSVTLACNFGPALNQDTSLNSAVSVTDISGNGLVPTGLVVSQDKMHLHCDVTSLTTGLTYTLRFVATTTDGQQMGVDCTLKVK